MIKKLIAIAVVALSALSLSAETFAANCITKTAFGAKKTNHYAARLSATSRFNALVNRMKANGYYVAKKYAMKCQRVGGVWVQCRRAAKFCKLKVILPPLYEIQPIPLPYPEVIPNLPPIPQPGPWPGPDPLPFGIR